MSLCKMKAGRGVCADAVMYGLVNAVMYGFVNAVMMEFADAIMHAFVDSNQVRVSLHRDFY